jgi:hypothetical protein
MAGDPPLSKKMHDLQQQEAGMALEYLNDLNNQKRQDKLDELKRNKQRLMELLSQKEAESRQLAQLHASLSQEVTTAPALKQSNSRQQITAADSSFVNDAEIENTFRRAENDFDMLLPVGDVDQLTHSQQQQLHRALSSVNNNNGSSEFAARSPSDLLWTQMKKQLNMRESLRNKKKELEDLIRDEHRNDVNELERSRRDHQEIPEEIAENNEDDDDESSDDSDSSSTG